MQTIVMGSLNIDFVSTGIKQFPKPGEHVYGKGLLISPGGKSRNIAQMLANLSPKNSIAMVGRTVKDPYGLWQVPIGALKRVGVNTDYIHVLDFEEAGKLPGMAFIPVDIQGNNQIYVVPGISDDFSIDDIDAAAKLFAGVAAQQGTLIVTLECPIRTVTYAVKLANTLGLKVMFDPGGIESDSDLSELLKTKIHLIKPNIHETKVLTGVAVQDFESAQKAATFLLGQAVSNVLITAGADGAYLFNKDSQIHIPIPKIKSVGKDETGCGDQAMAALCAALQQGKSLLEASQIAVHAGTLQFQKVGIQPLTKSEIPAL
jgi:ribokinase